MGVFVKHENCDNCGSSDGKAVYDDDSTFCFVCNHATLSDEAKAELDSKRGGRTKFKYKEENEVMEVKTSTKPAITDEENQAIKAKTSPKGNGFRGIRDDVYKAFGVRHSFDEETGEVTEQFYPVTAEGQLTGYKIRENPKNFRSKGRTGADCDLFMAFKFNRGGKYVVITEGECLLPSTKVLTRGGWVELQNYSPDLGEVMQANGKFAKPLAVVRKHFEGNLVAYKSGSYQITTTPEHNMIRLFKGEHIKVKAGDITKKHLPVPRVVKFDEQVEDDLHVRIQVMLSADFSFRPTGEILGAFKKQRKIKRCRDLLTKAGLKFTETVDNKGYGCFYLSRSQDLSRYSKEFDYSDLKYANIIIDELLYWDGNSVPNRNQIEYSSKLYHNAKFIQTCAHLSGYVSTIIPRSNQFGSWYKVSILFGKKTSSTQKGFNEVAYSGDVMCLTMPDGTLLVSENDSISVTGNCDSLAAYQMLKDYNTKRGSDFEIAAVSPTTGANSQKQIANNYKFLDQFDNIILAMDNDKAGKDAVDKIIPVLPKGKVKIMQMRYKDHNEYLLKGKEKEYINDFYAAKSYVPVGVLPSSQLYDRILQQSEVPRVPFPPFMGKLNDMFIGGMPLGYIFNIAADTGVGKTTFVNEMIYYWIFNSPHLVGIVSMELDAGQYGEVLLSRHIERKLSLIGSNEDKLRLLRSDKVKEQATDLTIKEDGSERFYLLDNRDGSVEEIQNTIEELVVACGCKVIICDPLQDILEGLSNEEQALFMKWAKGFIKSHNITFVLINHMRKSENSGELDIMGSSTIIKSAGANIILKRDKLAEDAIVKNTTTISVAKNRVCGLTGSAGGMYYDNDTHKLYELDSWLSENHPNGF